MLAVLYALLLIPEPAPPPPPKGAGKKAFRWDRDAYWTELEAKLREVRGWDDRERTARFDKIIEQVHRSLDQLAEARLP